MFRSMMESESRSGRLLRRIYGEFQKHLDSEFDAEINPQQLGFSVCIRHDMDRFDERGFEEFLRLDDSIDAPSTLFFLDSQYSKFPQRIRDLSTGKYERALHSESKPVPYCISVHQASRLLERAYARRLRRQKRKFDRIFAGCEGHAPHSVNNYLPFQGWINWNIIESASLRSGFAYLSDWRLPSRVAEGEEFPPPWPAYVRRRGLSEILVLPTSWDDKYFFYSFEDQNFRKLVPESVNYRPIAVEEAFASVRKQAEACRELTSPFVINIHPWHSVCNKQPQFMELKRRLVGWCLEHGIPMVTIKDILEAHYSTRSRAGQVS